jgi:hypothetical protein
MNDNRRYCPLCDDDTLILRDMRGVWKYGCMNFNGPQKCKYVQGANEPAHVRDGMGHQPNPFSDRPYAWDEPDAGLKLVPQPAQLRMEKGAAVIQIELEKRIPGFGKKYDDLTQEERDMRADILAPVMRQAMGRILGKLPYDKTKAQA